MKHFFGWIIGCGLAISLQAQSVAISNTHTYIFLLAGQSNMAGRGKPEAVDSTAVPNIFMLNSALQWIPRPGTFAF
ncbi:MAG: hypothetical protein NTZ47_09775 [Bacteroidetes bacterium]|nr:hypothetical protein [Bacteroidota bacterium]